MEQFSQILKLCFDFLDVRKLNETYIYKKKMSFAILYSRDLERGIKCSRKIRNLQYRQKTATIFPEKWQIFRTISSN